MINIDKRKIIAAIIALGIILIGVFQSGFYKRSETIQNSESRTQENKVKIVKMSPENLEDAILLPLQEISIEFNEPLVNAPEIRLKIEPKLDMEVRLSDDRKTVNFKPKSTYQVGVGYSLIIGRETRFESGRFLDNDQVFHFRSIEYRGI